MKHNDAEPLRTNEVHINHSGNPTIPRRQPDSIVIKNINGQENTFEGELLYLFDGCLVQFKVALTEDEQAALERLGRKVCGRVHREQRKIDQTERQKA
jgi:hypothetical protein